MNKLLMYGLLGIIGYYAYNQFMAPAPAKPAGTAGLGDNYTIPRYFRPQDEYGGMFFWEPTGTGLPGVMSQHEISRTPSQRFRYWGA